MRTRTELAGLSERLKDPLWEFVRESRVRIAVLVTASGQVLAQHGFTRSVEIVGVASLAASAHAAARALGEITGAGRWQHLYNQGRKHQLLLSPFRTRTEELILVAIFDQDSTLGLVRLFCDRLAERISRLPDFQAAAPLRAVEHFETDLEAGIESVFRSGRPRGN